jgi:hypothetical protein
MRMSRGGGDEDHGGDDDGQKDSEEKDNSDDDYDGLDNLQDTMETDLLRDVGMDKPIDVNQN